MQYDNDNLVYVTALGFPDEKLRVISSLLSLTQSRVIGYQLLPIDELADADVVLVYRVRHRLLDKATRHRLVAADQLILTVVNELPVPTQGPVIRWSAVGSHLLRLLDRVVLERWGNTPTSLCGSPP